MSISFGNIPGFNSFPWRQFSGSGSFMDFAPAEGIVAPASIDTFTNNNVLGLDTFNNVSIQPNGNFAPAPAIGNIASPQVTAAPPAERGVLGRVADVIGGGIRSVGGFVSDAVRGAGRALGIGTAAPAPAPDLTPTMGFDRDWGSRLNATGHIPAADRQAFMDKTAAVAGRLGMDPDHLMGVMDFESIGINPAAKNPNSTASGLIQVMEATARNMGTTAKAVREMPAIDQLDIVESYLSPYAGKMNTPATAYAAVFGPAHIDKPMSGAVYSKGSVEYAANRVNDLNKDGVITLGELGTQIDNRIGSVPELSPQARAASVDRAITAAVTGTVPDVSSVVAASLAQVAAEEKAKAVEAEALTNAATAAADVAAMGGTIAQQDAAAAKAATDTINDAKNAETNKTETTVTADASLSADKAAETTGTTADTGTKTGETSGTAATGDKADNGQTGTNSQGETSTGGNTTGGTTGGNNAGPGNGTPGGDSNTGSGTTGGTGEAQGNGGTGESNNSGSTGGDGKSGDGGQGGGQGGGEGNGGGGNSGGGDGGP